MRFFKAPDGPLEGKKVATVSSFLKEIGRKKAANHVDEALPVWLKKVPGLTANEICMTKLLIQAGGASGRGYVANKQTFKKIHPYL